MKRALAAALLLAFAGAAAPALAWGPEGHRVVGQIAADHLTLQAKAAVDALLAGEPDPTLAGVSNWSDEIRPKFPETGPLHYVNMPKIECRFVPTRDCRDGLCVVGGIEQSIAVLKNAGATREARNVALKNLVHFVGDVHQPLHAGFADDRGGNSYEIEWADKKDNLHRLWDSGLITRIEPDWQRYVQRLAPREAQINLLTLDAADWAAASCAIAKGEGFYPADHHPADAYFAQWQGTVDQQLALAGLRLTAWLNQLF